MSENFAFWIFKVILSAVKYYADTALGKVMTRIIMSEEYFIETAQRSGLKWENLPYVASNTLEKTLGSILLYYID